MRARLVVNAVCHQYLIPVWQVGTKIQVDSDSGDVDDVFFGRSSPSARAVLSLVRGAHRQYAARRRERFSSSARCPALHSRNPGTQRDYPQCRGSRSCRQRLPARHCRTNDEQLTSGVDETPPDAAPPCAAANEDHGCLHRMQRTTRCWSTGETATEAARHRRFWPNSCPGCLFPLEVSAHGVGRWKTRPSMRLSAALGRPTVRARLSRCLESRDKSSHFLLEAKSAFTLGTCYASPCNACPRAPAADRIFAWS